MYMQHTFDYSNVESFSELIMKPVQKEGFDVNDFGADELAAELNSIKNTGTDIGRLTDLMKDKSGKYQFDANPETDPNNSQYIPNVSEAALQDMIDYTDFQTTMMGISAMALISLVIASVMFSSNKA